MCRWPPGQRRTHHSERLPPGSNGFACPHPDAVGVRRRSRRRVLRAEKAVGSSSRRRSGDERFSPSVPRRAGHPFGDIPRPARGELDAAAATALRPEGRCCRRVRRCPDCPGAVAFDWSVGVDSVAASHEHRQSRRRREDCCSPACSRGERGVAHRALLAGPESHRRSIGAACVLSFACLLGF